jgi:hypothetical protein|tara:strand:- start:896 stop:1900 length:1005 start_codon:yes stop_codon:yes gene_type:complete
MSKELNKKEEAAKKMLEARDQINEPVQENTSVEDVSAVMLDAVESKGLGKVSMDNFGQSRPDKTSDEFLGWMVLDQSELPSKGKFYPNGCVIKIRSARAAEIRHFSTMDEENYIDMEEKLNHIVEMCTQITLNDKRLSYKDLLEEDRIVVLLSIRDLTFPEPENKLILKGKTESSKKTVDIELSSRYLVATEVPTEIEGYYSSKERMYVIKTRSAGEVRMRPPSIGVMQEITKYLKDRQEKEVEFDKAFIQVLPYITPDWRQLNLPKIFNLEVDYKAWDQKKFMVIYRLAEKMKIGVETTLEMEFDGEIAKAPLDFPGGIKSLFIISDLAGELL